LFTTAGHCGLQFILLKLFQFIIILGEDESLDRNGINSGINAPSAFISIYRDRKGRITKYLPRLKTLYNGLEYFFVEVTCDDGSQYGIEAYGEEAVSLHEEVNKIIE
jgi:hypothetical protein